MHFIRISSLAMLAFLVLGIVSVGIASAAPPVVIDFEGFAELTPIGNQYIAQGVVFSLVAGRGIGGLPLIATEGPPNQAFTGPLADTPAASGVNTLTDGALSTTGTLSDEYRADFTMPVTSVSLVFIDFRGDCGPDLNTATLNAFDAPGGSAGIGSIIASDSFTTSGILAEPDGNHVLLQVASPGIMSVELNYDVQECGTAIDDFTFHKQHVDQVPEFGAFAFPMLLALGFAAIALLRKRATHLRTN